jgi:hypothetical protein
MTTSEAVRLQTRWKLLKNKIKCQHRVQVVERSDKGYLTGKYVCTGCGEVIMPTFYLTENSESKQPLSKALAQHPLVLLDQQLKRIVEEDDAAQRQVRRLKNIAAGMPGLLSFR